MEYFLNWLCGSKDYIIIRCQKITKDELRNKLISFIEENSLYNSK